MKLHLVRHCQSNWNVITAGEHVGTHPEIVDVDSRLSEAGEAQAATLSFAAMQPPPQLVLASPLSRAMLTAIALTGGSRVEIRAEPLATEWCENSCDVGRPPAELDAEFGQHVTGLAALDARWWPLTQAAIASGERETKAGVDARTARLVAKLRCYARAHASVTIVSHCMTLQKLQQAVEGLLEPPSFLDNGEIRTITCSSPDSPPMADRAPPSSSTTLALPWLGPSPATAADALQKLWPDAFPSASSARKVLRKRKAPIFINGAQAPTSSSICPGDTVTRRLDKATTRHLHHGGVTLASTVAATGPLVLAYLDAEVAVVVKDAGTTVIGWGSEGALYEKLLFALPPTDALDPLRRPAPCHRIDKPTFGLLVVARTKAAGRRIGAAFEQRQVRKRYRAIVHGELGGGYSSGSGGASAHTRA